VFFDIYRIETMGLKQNLTSPKAILRFIEVCEAAPQYRKAPTPPHPDACKASAPARHRRVRCSCRMPISQNTDRVLPPLQLIFSIIVFACVAGN
jgi:hypothetical protein